MANEISVQAQLTLTQINQLINYVSGPLSFNQVGSRCLQTIQAVLTTAGVIQIGSIGTLGWALVVNLDTSTNNEMYLMTSTVGTKFARLLPGELALLKLGPDITAPAIMALSTASEAMVIVFEL